MGALVLVVAGLGVAAVRLAAAGPGPPVVYSGRGPDALALTPDGRTLYVADWGKRVFWSRNGHTVTPVSVATGSAAGRSGWVTSRSGW